MWSIHSMILEGPSFLEYWWCSFLVTFLCIWPLQFDRWGSKNSSTSTVAVSSIRWAPCPYINFLGENKIKKQEWCGAVNSSEENNTSTVPVSSIPKYRRNDLFSFPHKNPNQLQHSFIIPGIAIYYFIDKIHSPNKKKKNHQIGAKSNMQNPIRVHNLPIWKRPS